MYPIIKTLLFGAAGYASGRILGKTEEEKQLLSKRLARITAGIAIADELLSSESEDTVNYKLIHKKKCVYAGICYEDRLDARISEHRRAGKVFDDVIYDYPKSRTNAGDKEYRTIRRSKPKYNRQHNW